MLTSPVKSLPPSCLGTILVVSRDQDTQNQMVLLLKTEGYRTIAIDHGAACLEAVQNYEPVLILLDIDLLKSDLATPNLLKELTEKNAKVIILASSHNYKEIEVALMEGANDYFIKPISDSLILHRIHKILRQVEQENYIADLVHKVEQGLQEQEIEAHQMDERMHTLLTYFSRFEQVKLNLIKNLSHNIRNPLAFIYSSAELLKYASETIVFDKDKHLDRIIFGVEEIVSILDDLQLFQQETSGILKIQTTAVNLPELCLNLITQKRANLNENQTLQFFNHCQSLPPALVDVSLWRQIVCELLTNSIRFSPHGGGIEVRLSHQPKSLFLQVRDQGIGIPNSEQSCVFEEFFRASNANSIPGTPGVGLGMTMVRHAVLLHGGTISLESEVGRGTTVLVSIPLIPATGCTDPAPDYPEGSSPSLSN